MKIESVCIKESDNSIVEFARIRTEKAIILIKNEDLAKWFKRRIKKFELEEIVYAENKKIFLVKSIGTKYSRPECFSDISEVYYVYSTNRAFCEYNPIVEALSDDQLVKFLEMDDDRKWKVFSRKMDDGDLYVTVKPKYARNGPAEWRLSDDCSPVRNCNYDMDYKWKNYIFNALLKPTLEKHMN